MTFIFGPYDRIVIKGREYRWRKTDSSGYELVRDDGSAIPDFVSHEQMASLEGDPSFVHDPDYFRGSKARAREQNAVRITDLPEKEQSLVLWKFEFCTRFLELEKTEPWVSRGDEPMERAIALIQDEVVKLEIAKIGKKTRSGMECKTRVAPGCRALRKWLNILADNDFDPVSLRDGRFRSGNHDARLDKDVEILIATHAARFADNRKPTKKSLYKDLGIAIREKNQQRAAAGLLPLDLPSDVTFYAAIDKLNAFDTYAARHGIEKAKKKFAIVSTGLSDVIRPLQRVEIDEWTIPLQTLMKFAGVLDRMPPLMRKQVERRRLTLAVAGCVATKCILGMHIAENASAENCLAALEMVGMDKGVYTTHVGALAPWNMRGRTLTVATDGGSSMISDRFRAAAIALTGTKVIPPVGIAQFRAYIERLFKTAHIQCIAYFSGRTFENPVERGDYNSEELASLAIDELVHAILRWVIDVYHNTPHESLCYATPRNTWNKLVDTIGVFPSPHVHERRHIFGVSLTRALDTRGVRVLGIHYQSTLLHEHRKQVGDCSVEVRVDPFDLGWVSVRIGKDWHTVSPPRGSFKGVTIDAWLATMRDLRRRNLAAAATSQHIVDAAIKALQKMADNAMARAFIAGTRPTQGQIDHAEKTLTLGFNIAEEREALALGEDADPVVDAATVISDADNDEDADNSGGGDASAITPPATAKIADDTPTGSSPNDENDHPPTAPPAKPTKKWSFE